MKHSRRATIAVTVALMLIVLLSFAALILDLGYVRFVHAQLQVSADASAMGAAARLNRGASGMSKARDTAIAIAAHNRPNGTPLILPVNLPNDPDGDLVLGVWDVSTETFTPSTDAMNVNAVSIRARNPRLIPFFSGLAFGRSKMGATAYAVATHTSLGAGEVPYYLPFALPLCLLDSWDKGSLQSMTFVLNPDGADNTGWAGVNVFPSASTVKRILDEAMVCMHQWVDAGEVTATCTSAVVGASVELTNGVIDSGLGDLADHIERDGIPWDAEAWGPLPAQNGNSGVAPASYGRMIVGPIPVFDGGPIYCSPAGGSWNQAKPLHGFVWGAIYDVRKQGPAVTKSVWLRIDVKSVFEVGIWPGGGNWGVTATGPSEVVR